MHQLLVALGPCIHHFTVIPLSNLAFTFFGLSAFRISQSHAAFHWSYQCGSIFVVVCLGLFFFWAIYESKLGVIISKST